MTDDDTAAALPVEASRDGGRYRLRALLGRGGMGEVYLAHDERLRRSVAIKRIRPAEGNEEQLRARLEQEARVLAQLGHSAIVQVFDIFEDADGAWVVMELVQGRSLAAVLDEAPLSVDEVLRHGAAVAAALDAAHQKGIVHRDLKVENVMLSESGEVKVLDFGLAKRIVSSESAPSLSVEGQVLGTVRAMSPEQARGLAVDERSDLFSLGVLLYELASGTSPFAGASALDTLVRVSTHRQTSLVELPEIGDAVPRELSELVDELLEKAPEQRPASAAEVRDRLRKIAEERPRSAGAEPERRRYAALEHQPTAAATAVTASLKPAAGAVTAATAVTASLKPLPAASTPTPSAPPTEDARPPRRSRIKLALLAGLGAAVAVAVVIAMRGTGVGRSPSSDSAASQPAAPAPAPAAPAPDAPWRRDPKAEYERGMALLRDFHRQGAIETALGIFQRLLREDERSAAAYAGLARAYWLQYSPDVSRDPVALQQARAAADRAVALDDLLADARVSRGLVALALDRKDEAETDLRAAVALDGTNAAAHVGLGWLHWGRQHLDEAEAELRKAIALDPGNRGPYDELGAVLVEHGRYQDAIPLFEKSIALAPDSPYGYSNLGAVYLAQGRYEAAAVRFQEALKIRPSSSLYTNLGTVLFAQGLYGPSATAFERALALGGAAHDHLNWGNLADAYRQLPDAIAKAREHYDHAIGMIDTELARAPRDPTLRSRRALYLAKRGDCRRADEGLASLSAARDLPLYAVFRLAVTLEICGQRARAIPMLERALDGGFARAEIDGEPDLRALRADPVYLRALGRRGAAPVSSGSAAPPSRSASPDPK